MPSMPAEIVPELVMPPKKVETPLTKRPVWPAEIMPELLTPPEKLVTLMT